jgi:hypothetical protein
VLTRVFAEAVLEQGSVCRVAALRGMLLFVVVSVAGECSILREGQVDTYSGCVLYCTGLRMATARATSKCIRLAGRGIAVPPVSGTAAVVDTRHAEWGAAASPPPADKQPSYALLYVVAVHSLPQLILGHALIAVCLCKVVWLAGCMAFALNWLAPQH